MQDKDSAFNFWQLRREIRVEEEGEKSDSEEQECTMPALEVVGRVIQDE